jgi:hypothetical protein
MFIRTAIGWGGNAERLATLSERGQLDFAEPPALSRTFGNPHKVTSSPFQAVVIIFLTS